MRAVAPSSSGAAGEVAFGICQAGDLDALEESFPSGGSSRVHLMRYRQQQLGSNVYLVARFDTSAVGHLDLRWPGQGGSASRRYLPDCPEINGLVVLPELRSRGIGSALIGAAESLCLERGLPRACLGVSIDNPRARALYERLGYVAWEHGIVEESWLLRDESDREVMHTEQVVYLVKALE